MLRVLPHPLPDLPEILMKKADYTRHCSEAGRGCYHRWVNDIPFPRFHAYMSVDDSGMRIDLHFDALDSIQHKGNHDQPWAYEGGRVNDEMRRIMDVMCGRIVVKQINQPSSPAGREPVPTKKKKQSLFDILFRSL